MFSGRAQVPENILAPFRVDIYISVPLRLAGRTHGVSTGLCGRRGELNVDGERKGAMIC